MRRRTAIVGSVLLIGAIGLALVALPAYTDYAFACEYTCSHKGHRQWVLGFRTAEWYDASPIEKRLGGEALKHHWVSYAGTMQNVFGQTMSRGHGRPHEAAYARNYWPYYESLTDEQLRELYETLQGVETWRQREALNQIMQERLFEFMDAQK